MPPEDKQSFSPDPLYTRTTTTPSRSPPASTNNNSSLPTLYSVLASEPLRQHIAILTKDPSPPTIMYITARSPIPDDHNDVMTVPVSEASEALQEDEEEVTEAKVKEGKEEEEEKNTAHDTSDASSSTVKSSPEIKEEAMSQLVKQEREWSVTIEPTTPPPPTTTVAEEAALAGSGGVRVKQEAQNGSSGNHAPVKTEMRPDPHLSSQSTDDEEGGGAADVSFMSEEQPLNSQRSELGEHLSAEIFENGLSLNGGSTPVKIKAEVSRIPSDQDMRLQSPASPLMSPSASTQAATAKYKTKTITITKKIVVIDLDDSDDDGGFGGDVGAAQVQTGEWRAGDFGAVMELVEDADVSTPGHSTPFHRTDPSPTVLGKRVAKSQQFDDLGVTDERLPKRQTTSGSSQTCPVELLDSDSEDEWSRQDLTFVGSNREWSSAAAARARPVSSSGPGSGSGVSLREPQVILRRDLTESDPRQETPSLSQQIRTYQLLQRERFVESQIKAKRQHTPVAAPPAPHQQTSAATPSATLQKAPMAAPLVPRRQTSAADSAASLQTTPIAASPVARQKTFAAAPQVARRQAPTAVSPVSRQKVPIAAPPASRQHTPIAAPSTSLQKAPVSALPAPHQKYSGAAPRVPTHQPAAARNSQAPEPYGANFESPPNYQYNSEDEMEKGLPPAYAVRGPRPVETDYPAHMTKDGFEMTETQLYVLDQVINKRQNVFFTGSAGTGKSVLLRELILRLRAKHSRWRQTNEDWDVLAAGHVAVTASTGIAACNIRGCTLHSFAGIGLGVEPFEKLCWRVKGNKNAANRWRSTAVLVIDEVSMISAELLDLIEQLARFIRNDKRPWGGIQVVLVGDFFQLPPVERAKEPRFSFEADAWSTIDQCIQLQKVFRQRDHVFVDALNQLRVGILAPSTLKVFHNLFRPVPEDDGIKPTELFPLRKQVDESNASMLVKLPGESHFYIAQDSGTMAAKMEYNCMAPTKLELKVNAQVMLLKNQSGGSSGLVNGSIGVVLEMTTESATNVRTGKDEQALPSLNTPGELLPKVRFMHDTGGYTDMVLGREEWTVEAPMTKKINNNEQEFTTEILGRRIQIPLCLAWAMSIHKSQGQTLSKVKVDLGRVFEKGQAYVALSRATSLEGLQVTHFDARKILVHQKVIDFYEQIGGVPGP